MQKSFLRNIWSSAWGDYMKGKHTLRVMTKKVSFTLELKRKYTILRGDSGTGKSTFANYIEQYNRYGNSSGVDVDCDVDVIHLLRDEDFNLENKIIVIDEGDLVLRRGDVTKLFEKSSCYFIVITRRPLNFITDKGDFYIGDLVCSDIKEV